MPELPEVETMRRGLAPLIGERVQRVKTSKALLRGERLDPFPLQGQRLLRIDRRGKALIFGFEGGCFVCLPGMSGVWRIAKQAPEGAHRHLWIRFERWHAAFFDPRRFAILRWFEGDPLQQAPLALLGPEPLDCSLQVFVSRLTGRRAPVKAVLMDGRCIAGIGNIYANEICFAAGIDPRRGVNTLSDEELGRLYRAMRSVLQEAIAAGGATIRDFAGVDGRPGYFAHRFAVYGRAGQPCLRCGESLIRIRMRGRSTFFCPRCQR